MKRRIKMLESTLGSEKGNVTTMFKAGIVYDVESSLSDVFVGEMRVAEYTNLVIKSKPLLKPDETPELPKTLKTPPKTWAGLTLREKASGVEAKIVKTLTRGDIQLSSGEIVSYRVIRKEWEIVNGD